ncbi:MAG TPA: hypothetical protein VMZ00_03380 [Sporichthya sp.]|nr:hypothetical protein [Sporichthya sp.]
MGHEFLSPEWITSVKAVRDEYAPQLPEIGVPALRVNLLITGAPDTVAADGVVHAHADTGGPSLALDTGSLEDPDLTVTVDYNTAYDLLVTQKPNAAIGAFLSGRIKLAGDIERLTSQTGFDPTAIPALLANLGITGSSSLADVDPLAAEIGGRIRALTA